MLEEVARAPAIDKASAELNDKGQPEPDVFSSTSPQRTAAEPRGIPRGFPNQHVLPALVSGSALQRPATRLPVGMIFYLASITLVATATIGVFFGVGFFLLMGSADGIIPSAAGTYTSGRNPPFFVALSRFLGRAAPSDANLIPAPVEVETPGSAAIAALPPAAPSQPSLSDQQATPDNSDAGPPPSILDRSVGASQVAPSADNRPGAEASEAAAAPPALPTGPAGSMPSPAVAEAAPASPRLILSPREIGELLARGDTFLRMGDVTSARLFYERAANAGNEQGAMRMGATYDPSFLGRAGLGSARSDPAKAQSWYRRAIDLSAEIKQPRNALETR